MQPSRDIKTNFGIPPPSTAASGSDSFLQSSVRMTLEDSDLWKSFHEIGTEMIITKPGRRMFPHCKINLSGLLPYAKYIMLVDLVPVDGFRYKWNKHKWEVAGKRSLSPPAGRTSTQTPRPGSHWMKQPVSFLKLKLTNNTLDQHGHIILHSMHCYQPRFHIVQADDLFSVRWSVFQTFSFSETTFTAVTAYQNGKITKLKIDNNPFAKGFREQGTNMKRQRTLRTQVCPEKKKLNKDDEEAEQLHPAEFRRPYYEGYEDDEVGEPKTKEGCPMKEESYSPWGAGQDHSHNIRTESPLSTETREIYNTEQLVPSPASYQPYSGSQSSGQPSFESQPLDVATVPDQDAKPAPLEPLSSSCPPSLPLAHAPQDYAGVLNVAMAPPATKPGVISHLYNPYTAEQGLGQWNGPPHSQYGSSGYPAHHLHSEYSAQSMHHGYHHGNVADWSQYPSSLTPAGNPK